MTKAQRDAKKALRAQHIGIQSSRTEIARSFSYKLNVGNYESRDFFCSQKSECSWEDAPAVSEALYGFCKTQVLTAVKEYRANHEG